MPKTGKIIGFGFLVIVLAIFGAFILPDFAASQINANNREMNQIIVATVLIFIVFGALIPLGGFYES